MKIGQTMITFVHDGEVRGDPQSFFPGSDWTAHADLLDDTGQAVANVGSFLIRTDAHVILVDLGLGPGGALLDNLAALGTSPADVDLVLLTHLHRDHVGWAGAFPRARHLVERREWDFWSACPGGVGPDPERVLPALAGDLGFLDELPAGIRAIPTPGHTPGHTSFLITDPGTDERVLVLGDLLHTRAQFDELAWQFRSDDDPARARRQRAGVLTRFRDGRTVLAGGHFAGDAFEPPAPRPAVRGASAL
ncbi:MBL fold metallo-hydrolase [Actinoplanes cyaneus]|nr:MBL fold metallo-hydrolase [Actinoplanes cyaneus]MCW2140122.1 Glyoxylase, beta-lactamase superfamily II [Actinoplanes cyaneus]